MRPASCLAAAARLDSYGTEHTTATLTVDFEYHTFIPMAGVRPCRSMPAMPSRRSAITAITR